MSVQAIAWALNVRLGSPTAKVLLLCIANYADDKWECYPSQKRIAGETELDERTIRIWLGKLEANGYITRKQRRRPDGYRTTDLLRLVCDEKERKNLKEDIERNKLKLLEKFSPEKISGENCSAESDDDISGFSTLEECLQIPDKEPSIEPLVESSFPPSLTVSAKSNGGRQEFDQIWQSWPKHSLPGSKEAARRCFENLTPRDRALAVENAIGFLRNCNLRKEMPLMIPYFKHRIFEELSEGPEINLDGRFVIEPGRPEWGIWLDHFETTLSAAARERTSKQGYLLTKTRFPAPEDSQPRLH